MEAVSLIVFAIIPVIIEIGQSGQGLLEGTSLIRVQKSDRWVIHLNEF